MQTNGGCHESENTYILITQCLQNNFFLADENRLCLPKEVVAQMLVGTGESVPALDTLLDYEKNHRKFNQKHIEAGPLYQFLDAAIYADQKLDKSKRDPLHIINIQDWHERGSKNYDAERRLYGLHCEADTWEADTLHGFDKFFKPWLKDETKAPLEGEVYNDGECNYFYRVHSDSLFDFQPKNDGNYSTLTTLLDRLINGQNKDVSDDATKKRKVYIVVIGVYSDIKIMTLLTGLRSRYHIDSLIVSDVLTASSTLERHLAGLDYADKVLDAEVTHSLNELARILNRAHERTIDTKITKNNPNFNHYKTYYLDKQNVLSYQDSVLSKYLDLTEHRAAEVYKKSQRINMWLTWAGFIFLAITIGSALVHLVDSSLVQSETIAVFAGISVVQFVATFFTQPMGRMQDNLNNLVRLRNYLETYSTTTALLRHHLTRPEYLNPVIKDDVDGSKAGKALTQLGEQMGIVQKVASQMSKNFEDITQGSNEASEDTTTTSP